MSSTSGTFTPEGTFEAAIPHLRELAELGDHRDRDHARRRVPGPPRLGLRRRLHLRAAVVLRRTGGLAEAGRRSATSAGLAVILDVVYNHVGASGTPAIEAFGPYFTGRYATPWGSAINYDDANCDPVREWVAQSAVGWIRDYGIDGLRLDAIHAIFDSSAEHIVAEVARRVHVTRPDALVIAESGLNDPQRDARPRRRRLGLRRGLGRRLPPRGAHARHGRARRLLLRLRVGRAAREGLAPSLRLRRHLLELPPPAVRRTRRRRATRAVRGVLPGPRPGRKPRPAAIACRRRHARWPHSARCCRRTSRCCSWARSTARTRRFSSSQTTSTRASRRPRARAGVRSSRRSPSSRRRRSPTRRIGRRSSARS